MKDMNTYISGVSDSDEVFTNFPLAEFNISSINLIWAQDTHYAVEESLLRKIDTIWIIIWFNTLIAIR